MKIELIIVINATIKHYQRHKESAADTWYKSKQFSKDVNAFNKSESHNYVIPTWRERTISLNVEENPCGDWGPRLCRYTSSAV